MNHITFMRLLFGTDRNFDAIEIRLAFHIKGSF